MVYICCIWSHLRAKVLKKIQAMLGKNLKKSMGPEYL